MFVVNFTRQYVVGKYGEKQEIGESGDSDDSIQPP